MRLLVVDASVAAAIGLKSQSTAAVDQLLLSWDAYRVFAPYVFALETPWVFLTQERRHREPGLAANAMIRIERLSIVLAPPLSQAEIREVFAMAVNRSMGLYDAMYVKLAHQTGAAIASRDRRMIDVARALGVEALDVR